MKIYLKAIILIISLFFCVIYISSSSGDSRYSFTSSSGSLGDNIGTGIISKDSCIKDPNIQFFMYHYIRDHEKNEAPTTRELSVAPTLFEEHMKVVRSMATKGDIFLMKGNNFIESMQTGCFPGKDIWIFTADDGWIDMRDNLVPIASKYRIPFFLGIITGKLGQSGFVGDSDVKNFSRNSLMTISSHSVNHVNNAKLDSTGETLEMCNSKALLEKISELPVLSYIYPSGRIDPSIDIEVAQKCGYKIAWSTSFGSNYNDHSGSIYDLNRVRIHADTSPDFFEKYYRKLYLSHVASGATFSGFTQKNK